MNTKECPKCKRTLTLNSFMGKDICMWCRGNKIYQYKESLRAERKTIPLHVLQGGKKR